MALTLGELSAIITADDSKFRKTLAGVKRGLEGVGKLAGFTALAGSATTFAVALAPAIGLLAAAPAALAAVKLATITLSMALDGLGDALGAAVAGDAKAFQEALKELPPSMRAVAGELGGAAFGLKKNVQNAFFKPMKAEAKGLGKDLRGPLHSSMVTVADALGGVGARLVGVVREGRSLRFLKDLGRGTAAAIDGIGRGVPAVMRGVRDLAGLFIRDMGKAGSAVGGLLGRFGAWMSRIAKGGDATRWVRDALTLFRQLGRIAANLGTVLGAVFGAASTGAGDLLGSLEGITARMAAWAESAEGQESLANLFNLLNQTAADLMVVLPVLGGGLALIADLIGSMPPGMQGIVTQGLAFALVAGLLIGRLGPLFKGLGAVAGGIGKVGKALLDSESGVRRFASRIGSAATSAGRWAARMASAAGRASLAFAKAAGRAALSAATMAARFTLAAARVVAGWVLMAAQAMARAVVMAAAWLIAMGPVALIVAAAIAAVALIIANWDKVKNFITKTLPKAVKAGFAFMVGLIKNAAKFGFLGPVALIIAHWSKISKFFTKTLPDAVGKGIGKVVGWVRGLPGALLNAVGNLGGLLYGVGRDILVGLWNGLVSMSRWLYNAVMGLIKNIIPGPILRVLGIASPSKLMIGYGKHVAEGLAVGMTGSRSLVARAATDLAGAAAGAGVDMRGLGGARAGTPIRGGGAGRSTATEVIVRFVSDDAALLKRIRKDVRVKGRGDVRVAFGGR